MIELFWLPEFFKTLTCPFEYIAQMLAWMSKAIHDDLEGEDVYLASYVAVRENQEKISTLIITGGNPKSDELTLDLLKQPPGEFKGKYQAYIIHEEPQPVKEKKDEEVNIRDTEDSDCCDVEIESDDDDIQDLKSEKG